MVTWPLTTTRGAQPTTVRLTLHLGTRTTRPVFIGSYRRSLDDKLRFSLPRDIRDELDGTAYIARTGGETLELFTGDEFRKLIGRIQDQVRAGERSKDFLRGVSGSARKVTLDGQNRIKLPAEILRDDERTSELVLTGIGNSVEIRPTARQEQIDVQIRDAIATGGGDLV